MVRQKHNYTDELELKSLLIREQNKKCNDIIDTSRNKRINELINLFVILKNKRYKSAQQNSKKTKLMRIIKSKIIQRSEITCIDKMSRERLGDIILLMIKNILKKRNFSGYTWHDDFISEACHNVFKYIYNFNHKLESEITGQAVNSFSYVTQIIHNAILLVISNKNKLKKQTEENNEEDIQFFSKKIETKSSIDDYLDEKYEKNKKANTKTIFITPSPDLYSAIIKIFHTLDENKFYNIIYPENYLITFDEYEKLKPYLKNKNILRQSK